MKEEFEAWAKARYMSLRLASTGEYWIETTQFAWEAWQASRETVEIEAPDYCDCCYAPCEVAENFIEAILNAGLKVKRDGN